MHPRRTIIWFLLILPLFGTITDGPKTDTTTTDPTVGPTAAPSIPTHIPTKPHSSSTNSNGAIFGIVLGAFFLLLIVALLCMACTRCRQQSETQPPPAVEEHPLSNLAGNHTIRSDINGMANAMNQVKPISIHYVLGYIFTFKCAYLPSSSNRC